MIDVWEGSKPRITVRFRGHFEAGATCKVTLFRYANGRRGTEELVSGDVPVSPDGQADYDWDTTGALGEDALSDRFHYEARVNGQRGKSDSGDFTVWARTITVLGKGADDAVLVGARFRVTFSLPGGGQISGLHVLAAGDTEGQAIRLPAFGEPKIAWAEPYELVSWEKTDGRKRIAKVLLQTWKAVFKQHPERGAGPGCELVRTQYVNLPAVDAPRRHGHTVLLQVGANQKGQVGQEVFVEVKHTGPGGGDPSRRNDPLPGLAGGAGSEPFDYTFRGAPVSRPTKWTAHVPMDKTGEDGMAYADLTLELGLAGGDTFTIRIGHDASCGDGQLVITNWRRIAYKIFHPGPALSSHGKLSDGDEVMDPKQREKARKEAERVFIEYDMAEPEVYEAAWGDVLGARTADASVFGGSAGKLLFALDTNGAKELSRRCKAARPLAPHEHAVVVGDHLLEDSDGSCLYTYPTPFHSVDEILAIAGQELRIPVGKKEYLLPHRIAATGIAPALFWFRFVVVSATIKEGDPKKTAGDIFTELNAREQLSKRTPPRAAPLSENEALIKRWASAAKPDLPLRSIWENDSPVTIQDAWVSFPSKGKMVVTPDAAHPVLEGLRALWALFPDLEVTFEAYLGKLKDNDAAGQSIGEGVLMYPAKSESDLFDTFLHELSHALHHAYGGTDELGAGQGQPQIPGVDYRKPLHLPAPPYAPGGGLIYVGHSHSGGHCAAGLKYADAVDRDHNLLDFGCWKVQWMNCINGGRGRPLADRKLCDECVEVLRASDASRLY